MNSQIEIAIILFSANGREINFRDIARGDSYLEEEEWTSDFLWGATGGFEVIIDGYKSIFRGFEFYVSLRAIDFLLHSIYWIEGKDKTFDIDEEFPDSVISRFQSGNFIKLSRYNDDLIKFSYLPQTSLLTRERGSRFFAEELFTSKDWVEATKLGLTKYFNIVQKIVHIDPENKETKILKNYINDWNMVSETLT